MIRPRTRIERTRTANEARAFVMWRYATPLGWLVTRHELATETGVPYHFVCTIIKERGWTVLVDDASIRDIGDDLSETPCHDLMTQQRGASVHRTV